MKFFVVVKCYLMISSFKFRGDLCINERARVENAHLHVLSWVSSFTTRACAFVHRSSWNLKLKANLRSTGNKLSWQFSLGKFILKWVGCLVEIWSNLIFDSTLAITRIQVAAECDNPTYLTYIRHVTQKKTILLD